jgi:hypothetical protein
MSMRDLWAPCFINKHGWKGFHVGFLLADNRQQRILDRKDLHGVPIFCNTNPRFGPGSLNHPHYMAICRMRSGPFGALQENTRVA